MGNHPSSKVHQSIKVKEDEPAAAASPETPKPESKKETVSPVSAVAAPVTAPVSTEIVKKGPLQEGDAVPSCIFKVRRQLFPFNWNDVSTEDLFKGKRVILFSLPGAFTPTCSSTHLPGFMEKYEEFKSLGIDEIYCLAVNDFFVMQRWGKELGLEIEEEDFSHPLNPGNFKKIKLIPDGAAIFTKAMGMDVMYDAQRGFGVRSWRYSAVLNDMKIEKLFVENKGVVVDNFVADPFEVSDAKTMMEYIVSVRKPDSDGAAVSEAQ